MNPILARAAARAGSTLARRVLPILVVLAFAALLVGAAGFLGNYGDREAIRVAQLQAAVRTVYVDPSLLQYAVRLVAATRNPANYGLKDLTDAFACGASPRATIALAEGAQALALMRSRNYVLFDDLKDLAHDVLRHRITLSYEALADGKNVDTLISQILIRLPAPAQSADITAREARRA